MSDNDVSRPFVLIARPNEVAVGIVVADGDVRFVSGSPEDALHDAWCLLDTACRAMEEGARTPPRDVVSAMGLLRPWVKN